MLTGEIFQLMEVLENNDMNNSKTARDFDISVDTVRAYRAKFWLDYEAHKKISQEDAERRARASIVSYDTPEELTVEVIDKGIEKVRENISANFFLGMDEMKRRLIDPVERQKVSTKDLVAYISALLPYLTFKVGEMTDGAGELSKKKDEFVKTFIETMTNHTQKSIK